MRKVLSVAVLLSLASFVPLARAQGTYKQIHVPGASSTVCYGINSSGEIVGGYEDRSRAGHGFVLSGGSYTTIDYPGGTQTTLFGINDTGQVAGSALVSSSSVGFVYDRNTGSFTDITFRGASGNPVAINNGGTIVAYGPGYSFEQNSSGKGVIITLPHALSVSPYGIDSSGAVVGSYAARGGSSYSFQYRLGNFRRVVIPSAPYALVYATSASGTALAGTYLPGAPTDGFLYQNGIVQTVAYPGARDTYPFGVNDTGQISGIYYTDTNGPYGFTWTPPDHAAKK